MKSNHVFSKALLALSILFLSQVHSYSQCVPRVNSYCCEILPNSGCGTFTSFNPYSPGKYFRTPVLPGASYTISTCGVSINTQITGFQGTTTTTSIFYNNDNGPMCNTTRASITYVPNFNDHMRVAVQEFPCQSGGSDTITVLLRQNNNLNITSSGADMCEGQARNLTATPAPVGTSQPNAGDLGTFSGTGVSGSVFTAPLIGGTSAMFTISYAFGYCSATQNITVFNTPSTANAGPSQTLCANSSVLAGNTPTVGTGTWTVVSGPGSVITPGAPNSTVIGLVAGAPTTFRWTITNGPCTASTDDVVISRDQDPTGAAAGTDQTICSTSATLAANTPTVGSGAWSLIGGSGTITTPSSPTSGVTGLGVGPNTFRWTISNGVCPSSTDDVVITRDQDPTTANAGPDEGVCASTTTLAGNTPVVGSGSWSLIGGSGAITTPSSPTSGITGLGVGPNTFRWTISHSVCTPSTDDVTITHDENPTIASAGMDQTICSTSTSLAGNTPSVGTGAWSLIGGSGTITTPSSPTSGVTGLGVGANTFRWTISNGVCTPSTDDVSITRDQDPTTSDAGMDQTLCATSTTLAGNTPTVGSGAWSLIGGAGTITTPSSPTSGVTGLGVGTNTFRWTISNGICPSSTDDVVINRDQNPTTAAAGPNQSVCGSTATLAGNGPSVGSGTWSLVGGSGTITTPADPNSGVTALVLGENTFRWTISNGVCPPSTDDVVVTRDVADTDAGPDQTIPIPFAVLDGNSPGTGTGTGIWNVVLGAGTFNDATSHTAIVSGMNYGVNRFSWTITGSCAPGGISDTVEIIYDCEAALSLIGIYPSGTYQADSSLTMRGLVPSPNIVAARAETEVNLADTFEVELGAEFNAIIDPCGTFLMENESSRSSKTDDDKEEVPSTNEGVLLRKNKLE